MTLSLGIRVNIFVDAQAHQTRVEKQQVGSGTIGMPFRVKTGQQRIKNVSCTFFVTLFFDAYALVQEVFNVVSKRVNKQCVSNTYGTPLCVKKKTK